MFLDLGIKTRTQSCCKTDVLEHYCESEFVTLENVIFAGRANVSGSFREHTATAESERCYLEKSIRYCSVAPVGKNKNIVIDMILVYV